MPLKADTPGTKPAFERHDAGLSWIAHPEEGMQRASHALATNEGVWLVDPVDATSLDERLADLGSVSCVVVLLDRHERDSAKIARRHDVSIIRPPGVTRDFDAPTEDVTGAIPGTDFDFFTVLDWPGWHEVGLWNGETLVIPESLGTNTFSTAGGERMGLNPVARISPPKQLLGYDPERVLCGHGHPVLDDSGTAVHDAVTNARRRLPSAWFGALRAML